MNRITPLRYSADSNATANRAGKNIADLQNFLKDYASSMPSASVKAVQKAIDIQSNAYKVARDAQKIGKELSKFRHRKIMQRRENQRILDANAHQHTSMPVAERVGIDLLGRLTNVEKVMNVTRNENGLTVTSDFEGLSARLQKKVEEVQDIFLNNCLESIKAKTPVDTGRARDGWYISDKQILNDVPYVPYLEMGTEKMRPFAMVASTVANKDDLLARAIAEAGDL